MDTVKDVTGTGSAGAKTKTTTGGEFVSSGKPKSFVVTMYVDALSEKDITEFFGSACLDAAMAGVVMKNWIVDDDETPELHQ